MILFDFKQPPPHPATLEEAQALIEILWHTVDQLQTRVLELEERLRLNSRNSSKPPSSDGPGVRREPATRTPSGRHQGGQPGHPGVTRAVVPLEQVDQVHPCRPPPRCSCGGEVVVAETPYERHQVFELPPIRPIVTEYPRYAGTCQHCGQRWLGELPAGVPAGAFGPGVVALIGLLSGTYHLTTRQIQSLLQDVFGLTIGSGTVSQAQGQLSAALEPVVAPLQAHVQQAPVVNVDETGHRQGTARQWLWVAVTRLGSRFRIDPHRSQAAAQALLGPRFRGVVGSDRYSAYHGLDPHHRQFCWAHLRRDFQRMATRPGRAGELGAELLADSDLLFHVWHRFQAGQLTRAAFQALMAPIQTLVEVTLIQGSRCGHPATERTCHDRLAERPALWTFVHTPGVEPTHNAAERALRGYVIGRKLSFGTQSARGNRFLERLLTVIATCRQQQRPVWEFLRQAVEAYGFGRPAPPLVTVPGS